MKRNKPMSFACLLAGCVCCLALAADEACGDGCDGRQETRFRRFVTVADLQPDRSET